MQAEVAGKDVLDGNIQFETGSIGHGGLSLGIAMDYQNLQQGASIGTSWHGAGSSPKQSKVKWYIAEHNSKCIYSRSRNQCQFEHLELLIPCSRESGYAHVKNPLGNQSKTYES
jgi:hypothetical protein